MAPDEPSLLELGYRLTTIEKRFEALAAQVEKRFDGLSAQVRELGFVRADVYAGDQRLIDSKIAAIVEKSEADHKLSMWAIALVCTVTIGAIVSAILAAGGVFR